jgi:hypothetical protein
LNATLGWVAVKEYREMDERTAKLSVAYCAGVHALTAAAYEHEGEWEVAIWRSIDHVAMLRSSGARKLAEAVAWAVLPPIISNGRVQRENTFNRG